MRLLRVTGTEMARFRVKVAEIAKKISSVEIQFDCIIRGSEKSKFSIIEMFLCAKFGVSSGISLVPMPLKLISSIRARVLKFFFCFYRRKFYLKNSYSSAFRYLNHKFWGRNGS